MGITRGWSDIGLSPSEVAVKEIKEESGFDVVPMRLLAVLDKKFHGHPPEPYHVYKMFIRCDIVGGHAETGVETSAVDFLLSTLYLNYHWKEIRWNKLKSCSNFLNNQIKKSFWIKIITPSASRPKSIIPDVFSARPAIRGYLFERL